ncbi:protein-L-isoaspartate O-methyltransferase family protein [Candidatus Halobonum tyrrellensis]|uniref:protein-L-isoaspartate(D-aspartate) O-methyltransferase n=1 Tax=Candidatus Halobonum tyrrellensis G22 TaxID=1324957 RepID=V4HI62_9EURY|nr:protein-L-isoaspartate O-methyltransferase [Candidatus Halobonum tyrrellensis]ESP87609.1 protein-L-isoaspartate(D-aspartate) O-methyltransferase [Candidatus Halobonum tyrrellensis G22]
MLDALEYALDRAPDERVLAAMAAVPRHEFVAESPYANREGEQGGTRVLSPATAARVLSALSADPGDRTLVVGAGVGYTPAVIAETVGAEHVHAVDISREMVYEARANLAAADYGGVLVDRRDGSDGLPEYAPFDRVLVEAAAVDPPRALVGQLAPDGRLVMPRGRGAEQTLVAFEPEDSDDTGDAAGVRAVDEFGPVAFRPLLVEGEQADAGVRNRTEREDAEFARQGYFAPTGWEHEWIDWDDRLRGTDR